MLRVHLPRVSGECTAPATAPSQLSHAGCASNRSNDKAQKRTTNDQLGNSFFPDSRYALKGGSSLVCCESLPSKRKAPRPGRVYRACTVCTVVLPGAEARPQQLARNAVHPETRSGCDASGRRFACSGLPAGRLALSQAVRLPGQFPRSHKASASRIWDQ